MRRAALLRKSDELTLWVVLHLGVPSVADVDVGRPMAVRRPLVPHRSISEMRVGQGSQTSPLNTVRNAQCERWPAMG